MKIGTLKKIIANIPDWVEVGISDMGDFSSDFEVATYYEGDTYADFIMPKYIGSYNCEGSDEQVILH